MPIKKRAQSTVSRVIIRAFHMEGEKRIITAQRIEDIRVKTVGSESFALIKREWVQADPIDPETRGGCQYEIYQTDNTA